MTQETYWAMRRRERAKLNPPEPEPKPKKKSKAKAKPEVTYGEGQAGELQGQEGGAVQEEGAQG